jgi:hypothetical protein
MVNARPGRSTPSKQPACSNQTSRIRLHEPLSYIVNGPTKRKKRRDIPSSQTEDKLYFFIEVPQGNDLSIVVRPKGLNTDQPKVEIKDMAWSDGPSELL